MENIINVKPVDVAAYAGVSHETFNNFIQLEKIRIARIVYRMISQGCSVNSIREAIRI